MFLTQHFLEPKISDPKSFEPKFVWTKILLDPNLLDPTFLDPFFYGSKNIYDLKIFGPTFFLVQNSLHPNMFLTQNPKMFCSKMFFDPKIFLTQKFVKPKIFLDSNFFFDAKSCWTQNSFWLKFFWGGIFHSLAWVYNPLKSSWWWVVVEVVSKPILVLNLSIRQAEQSLFLVSTSTPIPALIPNMMHTKWSQK